MYSIIIDTVEHPFNYIKGANMAKNEYVCDCKPINEELVRSTKEKMFSEDKYVRVAYFLKIVGDPTRCKIISALLMNEMCVGDIANVLSMTKSSISHQLSKMKDAGVVKARRNGKEIYYSLDDEHVAEIFELTVEHIGHKH